MIHKKNLQLKVADAIAWPRSKQRPLTSTVYRVVGLWLVQHWEWLLLATILIVVALLQGINMFHFPYFEDDEGTYMSQAWAIVKEGQLAPYTYWYDHAPAGWILIAAWVI